MDNKQHYGEEIFRDAYGKPIYAKTHGQHELVKTIENNDIIFVSGPAGSGKTFLASVLAVKYIKQGTYDRIILTRPVVEAGESLGFLPGELDEKIAPYMKPLYECMAMLFKEPKKDREFEEFEDTGRKKKKSKANKQVREPAPKNKHIVNLNEVVQVEPLAFMRGSTYNDCIVICDEAQNISKHQMKMFLTRMGNNCKLVINGDVDQCDLDLKYGDVSGLEDAIERLHGIDKIASIALTEKDIVRNKLIKDILRAYKNGRTAKDYDK